MCSARAGIASKKLGVQKLGVQDVFFERMLANLGTGNGGWERREARSHLDGGDGPHPIDRALPHFQGARSMRELPPTAVTEQLPSLDRAIYEPAPKRSTPCR